MKTRCLIMGLIAVALLSVSCDKGDGFDKDELKSSEVCLKVKETAAFIYQPSTCQMAFNRGRREFRAGLDNMSDYFSITMSEIPADAGQMLTASLTWTTHDDVRSLQSQPFKVEEISDDGTVWLWCARHKTLAVIKILY